jgi:hypothetical protein
MVDISRNNTEGTLDNSHADTVHLTYHIQAVTR